MIMMSRRSGQSRTLLLSLVSLVTVACTAKTGLCDDNARGIAFFETKIRPVLVQNCYECHSSQSKDLKAGLLLDTRAGTRKGGDSGPAVVPGDVESSLLISSIRYQDFEMPPTGRFPDSVIDDFVSWVRMGAPDPRAGEATVPKLAVPKPAVSSAGVARFWSFQPIENPNAPAVSDARWPTSPIDSFILSGLEQEGLRPAEDASPAVLIRRLFVDLIGLPPSPKELQSWTTRLGAAANDRSTSLNQQGVRELVDYLLDSPHFGERWGRHWLDLARYADSTGGGASAVLPDAWKYRDYVIRSFNDDTPYDRFIREQIAGDLLPGQNVQQRAHNLAATGFLVLGPRNYITDDAAAFQLDGIDEQVDTIGRVFLGMTVGCSRCHDHKFDSISHADYHALAGILHSTQSALPVPSSKNFTWNTVADPREDPDGSQLAKYNAATQRVRSRLKEIALLKRAVATAWETGTLPAEADDDSVESWIAGQEQAIAEKQSEAAALRKEVLPKPATFMAVRCRDEPADMRVRIRGNPHQSGEVVPRGFPQIISRAMSGHPTQPEIRADQSGRLELADWLASPRNPLTARVFVNRVWLHLFGRGLVSTVDNFGTTGALPTHPQLLDWLAAKFIEDGWSIKTLIRRIAASRTYRLGGGSESGDIPADPGNVLFGRRTRHSLDAETLRDTMLAVSGELDRRQGGRSFPDELRREFSYAIQSHRRSVYVPRFRNNPLEMFQLFDAANPTLVVGHRDQTILPTQALFLINNDFVIERSNASARCLLAARRMSTDKRIELLYLRTLCRAPYPDEAALAGDFIEQPLAAGGVSRVELWSALQQTLFECVDFRFVK